MQRNEKNTNNLSEVQRSAEDAFTSGLYCAESIVFALAKAQGLDTALFTRAATAFCSGMARTSGTCGALTGAVMGVSLTLGRNQPGESVQAAYEATQTLVHEFEQAFGNRNCTALLGCDLGTPEGQAVFLKEQLHERCAKYTSTAAEIAARIISGTQAAPIVPLEDGAAAKQLLADAHLTIADLETTESLLLFGRHHGTALVGMVGLQLFGSCALLRSLAVLPTHHHQGHGKALVAFAEAYAASRGVTSLFLLTTTAERFFSRLGYEVTPREAAPASIRATAQFSGLCPASSSFMSKRLQQHGEGGIK